MRNKTDAPALCRRIWDCNSIGVHIRCVRIG
ncbi:Uncharacterised protein [Vibrio cholerae]|nr:Uncharacterised protein [Vibrio cholerae]